MSDTTNSADRLLYPTRGRGVRVLADDAWADFLERNKALLKGIGESARVDIHNAIDDLTFEAMQMLLSPEKSERWLKNIAHIDARIANIVAKDAATLRNRIVDSARSALIVGVGKIFAEL